MIACCYYLIDIIYLSSYIGVMTLISDVYKFLYKLIKLKNISIKFDWIEIKLYTSVCRFCL